MNLAQALNRAISAYQIGNLIEAEKLCVKVTSVKRDFFDALNVLAVVQASLGKNDLALTTYNRALALRPNFADGFYNRGVILCYLKRHNEALASYDQAIVLRPGYIDALYNRGITLQELGRYDEAVTSYDEALALRPNVEALKARSNTLHILKRFVEAIAGYDLALTIRPDDAEACSNRGISLGELKRFDEALESYNRALTLRPDYVDAFYNRGAALKGLKRLDDALASYDAAISYQPNFADAHNNRGSILRELERFDEAMESYERVLSIQPNNPDALNNRGNVLKELGRFDEALMNYDRALSVRPDHAVANWNVAVLRLLTGDFNRGWEKHEWRWQNDDLELQKRNFKQPLWIGTEAIEGKTILLHSEQGLGDTLQFCRYASLVAARGARAILEVQAPLHELMSSLVGASKIISKGDLLPEFDFHCPLLSLPLAFETRLETIPSDNPYLRAPSQALMNWSARLGPTRRSRVGLVWSGNAGHKRDRERSIALHTLLPLLDIDATFVSLQKEMRSGDVAALKDHGDILNFGDELRDFSDTAALISQLDLVIAVDTSVAHLAGALGKPVWLLLTYVPDWRWLLDRDDSPWYPTARLFRQNDTREWHSVVIRVREALLQFIECQRQSAKLAQTEI